MIKIVISIVQKRNIKMVAASGIRHNAKHHYNVITNSFIFAYYRKEKTPWSSRTCSRFETSHVGSSTKVKLNEFPRPRTRSRSEVGDNLARNRYIRAFSQLIDHLDSEMRIFFEYSTCLNYYERIRTSDDNDPGVAKLSVGTVFGYFWTLFFNDSTVDILNCNMTTDECFVDGRERVISLFRTIP